MNDFTRDNPFTLGIITVDQQHQEIFDLANKCIKTNDQAELMRNFILLYRLVRLHFSSEEQLMNDCFYPNYHQHIGEHNQLLSKLVEINAENERCAWCSQDIDRFIQDYFSHMKNDDEQFYTYLRSRHR